MGRGEGIVLSAAARNALNQAKALRLSLFRGADPGLKVELSLKPIVHPDGSQEVDKVYVHVGSKEFCWKLEEKPPTFVFDWPGDGGAGFRLAEQGGKCLGCLVPPMISRSTRNHSMADGASFGLSLPHCHPGPGKSRGEVQVDVQARHYRYGFDQDRQGVQQPARPQPGISNTGQAELTK